MHREITHMVDGKQIAGLVGTASSSIAGYLDILEPLVGIGVTLIVGGLTAWYTWERASELRRKRKHRQDNEEKS